MYINLLPIHRSTSIIIQAGRLAFLQGADGGTRFPPDDMFVRKALKIVHTSIRHSMKATHSFYIIGIIYFVKAVKV